MSTPLTVPLTDDDAKGVEWALAALLADWKQARTDAERRQERVDELFGALEELYNWKVATSRPMYFVRQRCAAALRVARQTVKP